MIIGIDFDGTVVEHRYPKVGAHNPGAIDVMRKLVTAGHELILWTMRSGKELQDAVDYFGTWGIPLFGANENPEQRGWTESPKVYCQIYIDDAALGCPLVRGNTGIRPMVDWGVVEQMLIDRGLINE